jgi:hypothetical protein
MMRVATIVLGLTMALMTATVGAAARVADRPLTLTLRLRDYQHLSPKTLTNTQQHVAEVYRSIGIETAWAPTQDQSKSREAWMAAGAIEEFSIMIVSSTRIAAQCPTNALGCAAVGQSGGGRVAYVIYDRIVNVAIQANWDADALLGIVVAHEVGHLLLPKGSHSPEGIMRGHWNVEDLQQTDQHRLAFTPEQARLIRRTVSGWPSGAGTQGDAIAPAVADVPAAHRTDSEH